MATLNDGKKGFIEKYAKVLVFIATFLGATSSPVAALVSASSICIGFYRLTVALPFFIILVFANKEKRAILKKIDAKSLIWSIIAGIFLFLHFFAWFTAAKNTNIASAAVLGSLHPLVVLFITVVLYKKRVSWKSILAIIGALIGGALILCNDFTKLEQGGLYGNIMALIAAVAVGVYFAIGDKVQKKLDGTVYVLIVFFMCWLSFAVAMIVTKTPVFGYPVKEYLWMIYIGIACQIGCHAMLNLCIGYAGSLYASTVNATEPVFSIVIAIFLLGQLPTLMEIVGCIITITAILLYNKFERESINN